jgi:hypothetical protein
LSQGVYVRVLFDRAAEEDLGFLRVVLVAIVELALLAWTTWLIVVSGVQWPRPTRS